MLTVLVAAAFAVEIVQKDGTTQVERLECPEKGGVVRFVWPLSRVPADVKKVRVSPDFATARVGEEGYWVVGNAYGTFREQSGKFREERLSMPTFGMKTPRRSFAAIGTGMPHSFGAEVVADKGAYRVDAVFSFARYWDDAEPDRPYEDLKVEYRFLSGEDADYSGMARIYRAYQRERGVLKPIAERMKDQPLLARAATNIEVRIRQAWKPVPSPVPDQVSRTEPPVKPVVTFDRFKEIVDESVRQGVSGAEFCLVGWNRGGHDGAYPQLFPVEPALGGEAKLREAIAHAQARGFLVVGHANFRDCYMLADTWDAEYVMEKNADGSLRREGRPTWGGGRMYTMCPQRAYERFVPKLCAEMAALGFKGLFYIDVTTSRPLYPCCDPRHPMNNGRRAVWENVIMDEVRRHFGGCASEGAYDFCTATCDSALTVQWCKPFEPPKSKLIDGYVPIWQLVYNGTVLSTPFRSTINCSANPDRRFTLKLAEFGGRSTLYWHSNFLTNRNFGMAQTDLEATTDATLRQSVAWMKAAADEYARRSDLQLAFMDRHDRLADGVFRITYSNGAKMYVNYNEASRTADGVDIPPLDYVVCR